MKFVLAIRATIFLMLHQFTAVAGAARRVTAAAMGALPEVGRLGTQLVVDSALAIVVLFVATILSVYKPWGRMDAKRLRFFVVVLTVIVLVLIVLRHVTGGGLAMHGH